VIIALEQSFYSSSLGQRLLNRQSEKPTALAFGASNGQFRAVFRHQELSLGPSLDAAIASSLLATRAGIP
jgi:hypothetical protein